MNVADTIELAPVTVRSENVVHLPLGLLGFEAIKRYVLLEPPHEAPFCWLQVLDDPNLAFLLLPPREFLPDYQPDVAAEDTAFLELTAPTDALLFNIVTLRAKNRATANLKAPIVVNRSTLTGKQVILTNAADYSLHHPVAVGD